MTLIVNDNFIKFKAEYDPFQGRPNLSKWYEEVKRATNPYYEEAHVILNKVVQKNKAKL